MAMAEGEAVLNDREKAFDMVKAGVKLMLNDQPEEAKELFTKTPPNIYKPIVDFNLNLLNSGKIDDACTMLNQFEKEIVSKLGRVESMKKIIFEGDETGEEIVKMIEERIILADCLIIQALLEIRRYNFLTSMKGAWLLKRAWRLYKLIYEQVISSYTHITSEENKLDESQKKFDDVAMLACRSMEKHKAQSTVSGNYSRTYTSETLTDMCHLSAMSSNPALLRNYLRQIDQFRRLDCTLASAEEAIAILNKIESLPQHSSGSWEDGGKACAYCAYDVPDELEETQCKCDKSLNIEKQHKSFAKIDATILERLLSAITLGYGATMLYVSLSYPKNWLELIEMQADPITAIRALSICRKGDDIRSPLASFLTLWYVTLFRSRKYIGETAKHDIDAGIKILKTLEADYGESSLYLLFKARISILKQKPIEAMSILEKCIEKASFAEVKYIAIRETAWCYISTLNYVKACEKFKILTTEYRADKLLHSYMATVALGASGYGKNTVEGKEEFLKLMQNDENLSGSDLERLLAKRVLRFPSKHEADEPWVRNPSHWVYQCMEIIFFYTNLHNFQKKTLETIITAGRSQIANMDIENYEPIIGLKSFILGAAYESLLFHIDASNFGTLIFDSRKRTKYANLALQFFKACGESRRVLRDNEHLYFYSQYEISKILTKNLNTRGAAKVMLERSKAEKEQPFAFERVLRVSADYTIIEMNQIQLSEHFLKMAALFHRDMMPPEEPDDVYF